MVVNGFLILGIICSLVIRVFKTPEPRKVPEFMNQEPNAVARFVAECLHKHWQSVDDAVPYGDVHDTFSSDYSSSALDSNGWTDSVRVISITIFTSR
jgi:hypothetical protein